MGSEEQPQPQQQQHSQGVTGRARGRGFSAVRLDDQEQPEEGGKASAKRARPRGGRRAERDSSVEAPGTEDASPDPAKTEPEPEPEPAGLLESQDAERAAPKPGAPSAEPRQRATFDAAGLIKPSPEPRQRAVSDAAGLLEPSPEPSASAQAEDPPDEARAGDEQQTQKNRLAALQYARQAAQGQAGSTRRTKSRRACAFVASAPEERGL